MRHYASPKPWQIVKGPIGAIIGTLDLIGWNPVSPFTWIDTNGSTWNLESYQACREDMHRALIEQIDRTLWTVAAGHQDGAGLQDGPDLTVMKKHLDKLNRQGDNAKAGLLMSIAAGGNWSQKRSRRGAASPRRRPAQWRKGSARGNGPCTSRAGRERRAAAVACTCSTVE